VSFETTQTYTVAHMGTCCSPSDHPEPHLTSHPTKGSLQDKRLLFPENPTLRIAISRKIKARNCAKNWGYT
jgi:hypothetical protein